MWRLSCLLLLGFFPVLVFANVVPDAPHLVVQGMATIKAKPDGVRFTALVIGQGATAAEARKDVDTKIGEAVAVIESLGLPEGAYQIYSLEVEEEWEWEDDNRQPRGYSASRDITFELRNLELAGRLLDELLKVRIAQITDAEPFVDDDAVLRQRALDAAFADAKDKAGHLAGLSGERLGNVYRIMADRRHYPALSRVTVTGSRISETYTYPVFKLDAMEISESIEVVFYLR